MASDLSQPKLEGTCFCGAVRFLVQPPAVLKAYCHCSLCQRITACPFIHTIHFPESAFEWCCDDDTVGGGGTATTSFIEEKLDQFSFAEKPYKTRYRCKKCGVGVAVHNTLLKKYCVWGALFSRYYSESSDSESGGSSGTPLVAVGRIRQDVWDIIKPDAHIFYGTRMLDIDDGLDKWEGYAGTSKRL